MEGQFGRSDVEREEKKNDGASAFLSRLLSLPILFNARKTTGTEARTCRVTSLSSTEVDVWLALGKSERSIVSVFSDRCLLAAPSNVFFFFKKTE